ncbi:hypothetical protein [Chryseobacterium herbae]|uniref:Uncharacterized protein n=1 Tax=Chryseobacterium herbae TaxID=2976476 RepID=A0ABT2IVD3_9FLAO|nr:hypothetical protein [Chryseobacterium sp. pc1-10]MCT2562647.1 hypothetical protein [Chryseobacterium sp. pc1-10]
MFALLKKRVWVQEMICENVPRYGVDVVDVIVDVETEDSPEISNSGVEISDMFLRKFILYGTNVQIILRWPY